MTTSQPHAPTPEAPTLLALRALKLGDLLVAVPALTGLRRAFPHHRIVYAAPAWLAPIVQLVEAVDELLPVPGLDDPLPLPPGSVDIAVNLHGNGPESRARIEELRAARVLAHRVDGIGDGPPWVDGIHERERWARLVTAHGAPADAADVAISVPSTPPEVSNAAVVHVGAFYGSRRWPVERFAAVAHALTADGLRVVLTGGDQDRERALAVARHAGLPDEAVLAGKADLAAFAAVIAHAAVVITVDTGAAHLATAYRRPSVVIFGPAPPEEWGPPKEGPHIVLTDARLRRGEAFADTPDPALLAVSAEQVIASARSVMHAARDEVLAQRVERAAQEA